MPPMVTADDAMAKLAMRWLRHPLAVRACSEMARISHTPLTEGATGKLLVLIGSVAQ